LLGTSLKIIGIARREETAKQALFLGIVDEATTDMIKGAKDADIVFICTPINLIIPILKEIAPNLKPGAIVTDVGSTKGEIVKQASKLMPKGTCFIGGHPMAGKEKVKLEAAEADLFVNKIWILMPHDRVEELEKIIKSLGAKVVKMDAKKHDLVVAGISHMPLAVAAALVNAVAESKEAAVEMKQCAASGFKDATRIASGDPVLGVDMFTTNRRSVLEMISTFKKALSNLEKEIKKGDHAKIKAELEKAKKFRDSIFS
jgi:prephenate dehydrogenase